MNWQTNLVQWLKGYRCIKLMIGTFKEYLVLSSVETLSLLLYNKFVCVLLLNVLNVLYLTTYSTFGGNPLASAVAVASLKVVRDEGLVERLHSLTINFIILLDHLVLQISNWWYFLLNHHRAAKLGEEFRDQLQKVQQKFPEIIREVRGRGLLNAVDLNNNALSPASAYDICIKLKERGILAKPTHDTIIRLAPPLSIRYNPSPMYCLTLVIC